MARGTNTFSLGAGFNITGQEPIDSRIVVGLLSDLTNESTWTGVGLYNGLVVAVTETSSLYVLKNRDDVTNPESWVAVGGDVSADVSQIKLDITNLKNNKQDKVVAGNGIDLNTDGKTISVKIDPSSPELSVGSNGLKVEIPEYQIAVSSSTASGAIKSYELQKDGVKVGVTIDIPKDLVVTGGEVKEVETPDTPYSGAQVGDLYLELTIANQSTPVYIPVKSLTDIYVGSTYISVDGNTISIKYDTLKNQINTDLVNPISTKVTSLEQTVGNSESGLVKDVADLKVSLNEKLSADATVNGIAFSEDAVVIDAADIKLGSAINSDDTETYPVTSTVQTVLQGLNDRITSAVSGGLTSVTEGNGISVSSVSGNSQTISIKLDPKEGNKAEISSAGLFVPDTSIYWEELE